MAVCQGVGHQIEVGHLQEGVDGRRLVVLTRRPGAHLAELRCNMRIGLTEQTIGSFPHPVGQFIGAGGDFVGYLVDAEHTTRGIIVDQPVPESGAEVQTVVQVLRLDENIGIEQVGHSMTPSSRAAS